MIVSDIFSKWSRKRERDQAYSEKLNLKEVQPSSTTLQFLSVLLWLHSIFNIPVGLNLHEASAQDYNPRFKSVVNLQASEVTESYLHENKQCCKEKEGCPLNSVQYHLEIMDVC